jgi:hypothetical protein
MNVDRNLPPIRGLFAVSNTTKYNVVYCIHDHYLCQQYYPINKYSMTQIIYLINKSTRLDPTSIEAMLPALQEQISRDFAPLWGVSADLEIADDDVDDWSLIFQDNAGNSGNLGFHVNTNGIPSAVVGVNDAMKYSIPISTVASHELLEMIADPTTTRMVGNYIVEVCDPVSGDYYNIGDTPVSNFCTPRYFGYTDFGRFDQLGSLDAGIPNLLPGGMVMFWNGTTWCNTYGRQMDGSLPWRAHFRGRSFHRAKHHSG